MILTQMLGVRREAIEAMDLMTQDIIPQGGTSQGLQVIMGQATMTQIQELRVKGPYMTQLQELRNKDQAIMMENQELHVKGHIAGLIQELHLKGPSMMILIQGLCKRVTMTPRIELQDKRM